MDKVLFILVCIIFFSCASMKWKNNYIGERFEIMKNYNADSNSIILTIPKELQGAKKIKKMSKRKIRKIIYLLEKGAALLPDSVGESNGKLDSFYSNQNKIRFIKENNLITNNIHFDIR